MGKEFTMSNVNVRTKTETTQEVEPVDMKLEVVLIGVSDVDRARHFTRISAGGSTSTSRRATSAACS